MFTIKGFSQIAGKFVDTLHAPTSYNGALAIVRGFKALSWQIVNAQGRTVKAGKAES